MTSPPKIFAVVPAYCEERLIAATIQGVPSTIETILVVDDASTDATVQVIESLADRRTRLVRHTENRGVGAAIYTGYLEALALDADVLVVLAGDNQMDVADLNAVVEPILSGRADYVKGNRHIHPRRTDMPLARRWGSMLLAQFTSWAMGQSIGDSQCGYTALGRKAALSLNFNELWSHYGYPNDLLITLANRGFTIAEVAVRPVYADERSGLRPWHLLSILRVIARGWWRERHLSSGAHLQNADLHGRSPSNEQLMG